MYETVIIWLGSGEYGRVSFYVELEVEEWGRGGLFYDEIFNWCVGMVIGLLCKVAGVLVGEQLWTRLVSVSVVVRVLRYLNTWIIVRGMWGVNVVLILLVVSVGVVGACACVWGWCG